MLPGRVDTGRLLFAEKQCIVCHGGSGQGGRVAPDLAGAFPLALLLGFASISFMTVSTAIVQVRALPPMRGRIIALQSMLLLGSTPIGGPLLGAICDAYGPRAGLVVGGVAALAAAGWGFLKGRRVISCRTPARPSRPLLEEPEAAGAETA